MKKVLLSFLLLLALPLLVMGAVKKDDSNEPVYLKADHADLNQQSGHSQFRGNVTVDQGDTHLRASRATIETTKENKLKKAIAYSDKKNLAHFWTKRNKDEEEIHAYAKKIIYLPEQHMVILDGDARVNQGRDQYKAPHITYDLKAKHVVSSFNKTGRTTITIYPDKKRHTL